MIDVLLVYMWLLVQQLSALIAQQHSDIYTVKLNKMKVDKE